MFGEIKGVTEGQIFESRRELHDANVHNGLMRGIGKQGASIHIKPLGKPHNGPDDISNVLCLSPNIHVLFDLGAIAINDDLTLLGHEGSVNIIDDHNIDLEVLKYHRENIFRG